jgi:hypothetical protein
MKTVQILFFFATAALAQSVSHLTTTLHDSTKSFDERFVAATKLVESYRGEPSTLHALVGAIALRSPYVPKIAINGGVDASVICPITTLLTKLDPSLLPLLLQAYASEPDVHKLSLFGQPLIGLTRGNPHSTAIWKDAIGKATEPEASSRLFRFANDILLLEDIPSPPKRSDADSVPAGSQSNPTLPKKISPEALLQNVDSKVVNEDTPPIDILPQPSLSLTQLSLFVVLIAVVVELSLLVFKGRN